MTRPYILTRSAAADLQGIVRHTRQTWGQEQCRGWSDHGPRAGDPRQQVVL